MNKRAKSLKYELESEYNDIEQYSNRWFRLYDKLKEVCDHDRGFNYHPASGYTCSYCDKNKKDIEREQ